MLLISAGGLPGVTLILIGFITLRIESITLKYLTLNKRLYWCWNQSRMGSTKLGWSLKSE